LVFLLVMALRPFAARAWATANAGSPEIRQFPPGTAERKSPITNP
jgi:hypothetical protein